MGLEIPNDASCHDNPATYLQQAQPDAVDFEVIASAWNGTGIQFGCVVSVHSGGAAIDISAGRAMIAGVGFAVAAQTNIAITSGDASNVREDLVIVNSAGTASIVTGTAGAQACFPAITKDADGNLARVVLSAIHVPATATTITSSNLTDKRMVMQNVPMTSGWSQEINAWTRTAGASNTKSTFTMVGDFTGRYKRGVGVRWYESGAEKFGVVCTDATVTSGTTTVTLAGNTDYWMAASPDAEAQYISHAPSAASNFPLEFNYTPTWAGFSTAPAIGTGCFRFFFVGRECTVIIEPNTAGTSNATTAGGKTVTMPDGVTALKQTGGTTWFATDNTNNVPTAAQPAPFSILTAGASATITIYKDNTLTAVWTASGNWTARFRLQFTAA